MTLQDVRAIAQAEADINTWNLDPEPFGPSGE